MFKLFFEASLFGIETLEENYIEQSFQNGYVHSSLQFLFDLTQILCEFSFDSTFAWL